MLEIDCRKLACPQPVLNTKDALDKMESGQLKVLVDNQAAVGNVTRFAQSQGCTVEAAPSGSDFILTVTKGEPGEESVEAPAKSAAVDQPKMVVKVANQFMGQGSEDLGRILIKAFLKTLSDATLKPDTVIFYNSGVFLTCQGSEHLEAIAALEKSGVNIMSCGTCLDFFNMKEKLAIGAVSNMFEIIEILSSADRVVSP